MLLLELLLMLELLQLRLLELLLMELLLLLLLLLPGSGTSPGTSGPSAASGANKVLRVWVCASCRAPARNPASTGHRACCVCSAPGSSAGCWPERCTPASKPSSPGRPSWCSATSVRPGQYRSLEEILFYLFIWNMGGVRCCYIGSHAAAPVRSHSTG